MELSQIEEDEADESGDEYPRKSSRRRPDNQILTAFDLAAKWGAVLLVDECDMFLEKRTEGSNKRNKIVSRTHSHVP